MRIQHLTIPSTDVTACVAFYRDVMQVPINGDHVTMGWTTLHIVPAATETGALHLAFNIPPHRFEMACAWLAERALILRAPDNEERFRLAGAWQSESVYFAGPHDSVLELIARQPLAATHTISKLSSDVLFHGSEILCVSEVGLPTDDVPVLVDQLHEGFGMPSFGEASDGFAPMGTHEGLLILVDRAREWFPQRTQLPGAMGVRVGMTGTVLGGHFADANGWVLSA